MKINFNGKAYDSVDEMPSDIRAAYEAVTTAFADKDGNGVPDIFEGKGNAKVVNLGTVFTSQTNMQKIFFEGKQYNSSDELPPDARAKYDEAMGKLSVDANQNGIPDLLEQGSVPAAKFSQKFSLNTSSAAKPDSVTSNPGSNDTRLFLVGIAIVILLLLVAAILGVAVLGPLLFKR